MLFGEENVKSHVKTTHEQNPFEVFKTISKAFKNLMKESINHPVFWGGCLGGISGSVGGVKG